MSQTLELEKDDIAIVFRREGDTKFSVAVSGPMPEAGEIMAANQIAAAATAMHIQSPSNMDEIIKQFREALS